MPERKTIERAKRDKREGKSASTQAGEFVREEIDNVREGKHGVRSSKQAIAIGLSKARRAGVKLGTPKNASASTKKSARSASRRAGKKASPRRSRASERALKGQPRSAASHRALSRQAHASAKKRTKADRSRAAKKAAKTRKREHAQ